MSLNTVRITSADTIHSALQKMSGGNPGALSVMMELLKRHNEIDPDSAMAGIGVMLYLDTLGIYESHIWILYKDVCGENLRTMVLLLRATQLGLFDGARVTGMAAGNMNLEPTENEWKALDEAVCAQLENFAREG